MFITPKKGEKLNIPRMAVILPAELGEALMLVTPDPATLELYKRRFFDPAKMKEIFTAININRPPLDEALTKECYAKFTAEQIAFRGEISAITGFDCSL